MAGGNLYDALIASVNLGRDTDCVAAIASGLAGALTGASSMPQHMIDQVDAATKENIYTNTQRTIRENADGLYDAYQARLQKMRTLIADMA